MDRYRDRHEAGRTLARTLAGFAGHPDTVVLGLSRGGVVVAAEVARALGIPLDVLVVRKLGAPGNPELAMGAIAPRRAFVINEDVVGALHISRDEFNRVRRHEEGELKRREKLYRRQRPPVSVREKSVIIVDDGLATGSTMRAAIASVKRAHPGQIIVAVPVGASETCDELRPSVNQLICPLQPEPLQAIGYWYDDFRQTSDEEVCRLLDLADKDGGKRAA